MESTNELPDSPTPEGEGETPETPPTPPVEAPKEHTTEEKRLYARMKQAEDELKKYKEKEKQTPPQPEQRTIDARDYARLLHEGYSDDEITQVEVVVKSTGKAVAEVLKMSLVEEGIKGMRAKKKAEDALPSPTGTPPTSKNEKSYKDMTADEKKQTFNPQAFIAKRRGQQI